MATIGKLTMLGWAALLVLAAGCAAGKGTASPAATTAPAVSRLTLTSSVADGATLTAPVSWRISTSGPALDHVDFFVDGTQRWTEAHDPYVFNDDAGLLAPWLLSPGRHVLSARANGTDGATGSIAITVQVGAQPVIPAGLTGTFVRTLTQQDFLRTAKNPGREAQDKPLLGRWTAHVAKGLLSFDDPAGGGGAEAFSATASQLKFWGSPNWVLPKIRQGGFCEHEPPGVFTWSRSGADLVITGGGNCADRDGLFVGTWHSKG